MKILILGHGRHGKDTLAEIMQKQAGLSFTSSSWACAYALSPVLDVINGQKTTKDHFEERHNYRELWKRLISLYNSADASALSQLILDGSDIYVGMRSAYEYKASKYMFDKIFWVDASKRVDYVDPTMEIKFDPKIMTFVDNNGSLEQLESLAIGLLA